MDMMRASPPNLVRKWRTPSERRGREQEGLSMISTTELEQEIARRESRLVEGERFRRAAPVAGMVLAFAAIVVEFAVLMASASMEEAIRVLVSAAAFLAGTFGLGLVLLGVLPRQVTLDMRRDLALAQLAEKAGEGRDGQGM